VGIIGMGQLREKVAVVTGGSQGIGRAIAIRLAKDGARVVLAARTAGPLNEVVSEIATAGGKASAIPLDLRLADAPGRLAEFALKTYGRIDIIVNNAGATRRGDFMALTDDDWADGFALKFFGTVRLTRAAWPHLKANSGAVAIIGGAGGRTPGAEFTIGGSVNAALLSFTKAMADRGILDGVQVNAINPGTVRTGRMKLRLASIVSEQKIDLAAAEKQFVESSSITRVGEPEDIASLVAFVVGPEGRFLHGSLIDIDGGATKTI
jgi:NAD(P)-dependent dehydrogenase (short-subunit alcohol dehydrogenase family)